jgi:hypothetical protein
LTLGAQQVSSVGAFAIAEARYVPPPFVERASV